MLPPPLRLLLRLKAKSQIRRMLRGAKTVRGMLYLIVMGGMMLLWIVPMIVYGLMGRLGESHADGLRGYVTFGLFAYSISTLIVVGPDSGLHFQPAEIDFLFPGPFRRRDVVMYRLSTIIAGCGLMSLFFSFPLWRHSTFWLAGYAGAFLALVFTSLIPTCLSIACSLVAEKAFNRARRLIVAALVSVVVIGVFWSLEGMTARGWLASFESFRTSWTGRIILAPFDVFARTISARTVFPELLGWGLMASLIDLLLVLLVLRLDADFFEVSLRSSQKIYERLQRARSGGVLTTLVRSKDAWLTVPRFPWLGGAGPIAWRQLITGIRGLRGLVIMLLAVGGVSVLSGRMFGGEVRILGPALLGSLGMMSLFFLPQMLQCDFRGDIDRLDVLKSLPVTSGAAAAGQLIAPVCLATLLQWMMLVALALVHSDWLQPIFWIALFLPPVNLLVFAVENLVFLVFPTRLAPGADIQAVGRQMLVMFIKLLVLGFATSVAAGVGGLFWFVGGKSFEAFAAGALPGTLLVGVGLIPLVALAYRRFDPSLDTPP
jgi:Putative ABC exporter